MGENVVTLGGIPQSNVETVHPYPVALDGTNAIARASAVNITVKAEPCFFGWGKP